MLDGQNVSCGFAQDCSMVRVSFRIGRREENSFSAFAFQKTNMKLSRNDNKGCVGLL